MPLPDNSAIAERLETLAALLDLAGASYYRSSSSSRLPAVSAPSSGELV